MRSSIGTKVRAGPHVHDLHLGSHSVHTTPQALLQRETEIRRIGRELSRQGVLKRSVRGRCTLRHRPRRAVFPDHARDASSRFWRDVIRTSSDPPC